jgi:hypothetical protein
MLGRNFSLKHVSEGQIEVRGKRKRRRKQQLLDDIKDTSGHWILKEGALDRPLSKACFGRFYGSVVRQIM